MKVAIASGKGGTGKTTLSSNLASYLSESEDVVLVDLDVEEPNSSLFLSAKEISRKEIFKMVPSVDLNKCTFCGECNDNCRFNAIMSLDDDVLVFPDLCHSCYACADLCKTNAISMIPVRNGVLTHMKDNSLSFIESRLDVGQEQSIPLIKQTLDYVDEKFSDDAIILLDSPPGTSCPVIEVTKDADYVILVTEPTPFGLHDLKIAVETMRILNKDFGVVANRYGLGNDDLIEYCEAEKIPLLAKIANDKRVAELYSKGSLLYNHIPNVKQQLDLVINSIKKKKGLRS